MGWGEVEEAPENPRLSGLGDRFFPLGVVRDGRTCTHELGEITFPYGRP